MSDELGPEVLAISPDPDTRGPIEIDADEFDEARRDPRLRAFLEHAEAYALATTPELANHPRYANPKRAEYA